MGEDSVLIPGLLPVPVGKDHEFDEFHANVAKIGHNLPRLTSLGDFQLAGPAPSRRDERKGLFPDF
jgi:hypothetical protein